MSAPYDAEDGAPRFPPLLTGLIAPGGEDLLEAGIRAARDGCDGGTVLYSPAQDVWEAALILAPEEAPLSTALTVAIAVQMAVVDAIGALAPPEVGVVWAWPDILMVNGAMAGRMRAAASTTGPTETPDWLVFALRADIAPLGEAPGEKPDRTSLAEEGCADLNTAQLTEVWARNTQLWLHRWMEGGLAATAPSWTERAYGPGRGPLRFEAQEQTSKAMIGVFLGLDEDGGLLLREMGGGVANPPLAEMLRRSPLTDPPRLRPADAD